MFFAPGGSIPPLRTFFHIIRIIFRIFVTRPAHSREQAGETARWSRPQLCQRKILRHGSSVSHSAVRRVRHLVHYMLIMTLNIGKLLFAKLRAVGSIPAAPQLHNNPKSKIL